MKKLITVSQSLASTIVNIYLSQNAQVKMLVQKALGDPLH